MALFFEKIMEDFIKKMSHPQNLTDGDCLELSEAINELYKYVHENCETELSYGEKLFCEFFIGFALVYRLTSICCTKLLLESNILVESARRNI
jgi:hypothetical protein